MRTDAYRHLAVLLLVACCAAPSARGATVAAQAGVFTVTCPTLCGGPGSVANFDGAGGEGFTAAFAEIAGGPAGSGRARAEIVGSGIVLPNLGAEAYPVSDGQVVTDAAAMQKYVYHGPDDSPFVLQLTLSGSVSAVQEDTAVLGATAAIVLASSLDFSADPATFLGEIVALDPNATLLTTLNLDFRSLGLFNLGQQSASDTLSFSLDDGDEVFIYGSLLARGTRGSVADAYSTFELEFTSGNVGGLSAVPLPAPVAMLIPSLGLTLLWRRGRRLRDQDRATRRPHETAT